MYIYTYLILSILVNLYIFCPRGPICVSKIISGILFLTAVLAKGSSDLLSAVVVIFSSSKDPLRQFQPNYWMKGNQVCSNEGPHPITRGDNNERAKIY